MSLQNDFSEDVVIQLEIELGLFSQKYGCYYDEKCKKIIYPYAQNAMSVYDFLQEREMEKHKWLESEKTGKDVGQQSIMRWIKCFSKDFASYWRKTHLFIK